MQKHCNQSRHVWYINIARKVAIISKNETHFEEYRSSDVGREFYYFELSGN